MTSFRVCGIARVLLAVTILLLQVMPATVFAQALPSDDAVRTTGPGLAPDVVYQATCPTPRPPVRLQTQALGDGRIQVTVTAGVGPLVLIRFGTMQGSHVEVPGSSQQHNSNAEIKPPDGATTFTFLVVSNAAIQSGSPPAPSTVPLTVYDGCGPSQPWNTFVGGGAPALQSTASIADTQVREGNTGNTVVTFTVTLSVPSSRPISFNYATSDGTAHAGTDYIAANGTVTFNPGETSKTITVQVRGNFTPEPDKTFTVTLSDPVNGSIGRSVATARIVNDDTGASASGDSYTATIGQTLNVGAGSGPPPGLLVNDQADSNDLRVVSFGGLNVGGDVTSNPAGSTKDLGNGGSLKVNADGSFTFTPPSNATGSFSFRYRATSSSGDAEATVIIDVRKLPNAVDDPSYSATGSTALHVSTSGGLLANDDLGAPPSVVDSFGGGSAGGTVTSTQAGSTKDLGNGGSLKVNADGSFDFTAPSNAIGAFTFLYRLKNAAGSDDATVTIDIRRGPTITTTSGTTPFFEGGAPVTVDAGATVSSPGSSNLSQLTATIQGLADAGKETLSASTGGTSITATYSAPTLTLSGDDTEAHYQQVLQSIKYQDTATNVTSGARTIQFTGTANGQAGNTATKTVNVGGVNNPPVGQNKTVSTNEDTDYTFSANDFGFSDPNDAPPNAFLAVKIETLPGTGSLKNNGAAVGANAFVTKADIDAGKLKFSPAPGANGSPYATFTFRVQDNGGTANGGKDLDQTARTMTINVGAVNDPPVVSLSSSTPGFTEGGPAVVVDGGLTVTDPDNTTLASATVTITNLLNAGQETLAASPSGAIGAGDISYAAPTLTISHAGASLADFQAVLRSVTYADSSAAPNTTARVIRFVANDGALNSANADKTVTVGAVDNAPSVQLSVSKTDFIEGGPAVVVDGGLTVTDVDSPTLASATVTITNLLDTGKETLAATPSGAIVAGDISYVAPTLTISHAGAPLADFQAVLQSVTYANSSDSPATTDRIVRFVVNDGTLSSSNADKTVAVTPTDDAPQITLSGSTPGFSEGGSAVAVDAGLTVTDADNTTLASATVTITNLVNAGKETLAASPSGAIVAGDITYAAPTLTINHAGASLTDFQTVLRSVLYLNTSDDPGSTARVIRFVANDGTLNSANADKSVAITPSNDAPVVTTTGGATAFTEGGGPVVVDGGVTVTDPDNTTLASATVTITNLVDTGKEALAASPSGAIVAGDISYAAPNLTISHAGASLADFQAVLQSVTYNNSSDDPSSTPRVIRFLANDGTLGSANADKTVTVTGVNDAPVVTTTAGTTSFTEAGGAVPVDNGVTVTDVDSTTLTGATVTITNLQDSGKELLAATPFGAIGAGDISYAAPTLTITKAGGAPIGDFQTVLRSVTYENTSDTPTTSPNRVIRFQVNDGSAANNLSNQADKTVTVTAVDDAPVVTTTAGTSSFTESGGPVVVDGGVTVTDPDNTTLASATVTISNLLDAGQETLAASPSGAIVAGDISYVAPTLTISHAGASLADFQAVLQSVTYNNTSNAPTTTNRTISFAANDGTLTSAAATKTVSVTSVNSAPTVTTTGGATAFTENGPAVTIDTGVTVNDVDNTALASATVTITNLLDAGKETLAASPSGAIGAGDITYAAPTLTISHAGASLADFQAVLQSVTYNNSSDTPDTTARVIRFVVNDGALNSANADKTVTVTATDDAPVVTTTAGTTAFTEGGGAVQVDTGVTVTDVDNTTLASATVTISNLLDAGKETLAASPSGAIVAGDISYAAPTLTITHAGASLADFQAVLQSVTYNNTSNAPSTTNRTISFAANDGTLTSAAATKTVSVTSVNSAPTVTTTGGATAFTENGPAVTVDTGVTVNDVDNTTLASATVTITNLLDAGQETLAASPSGAIGAGDITYAAPTLTITHAGASLADFQAVLQSVTYNNTSNTPSTTNRTISFVVNDGALSSSAANKTVSVTAVNDPPVVTTTAGTTSFTEDGGAVTVDSSLTVTDPDNTTLASATVTISNLLDAGQETLAATPSGAIVAGDITYAAPTLTISHAGAPLADFQAVLQSVKYNNASQNPGTTNRTISFKVNDGTVDSATATKTVSVTAVNDAPTLGGGGGTTAFTEGTPVVVNNAVTVADVDDTNMESATVTVMAGASCLSAEDRLVFTNQNGISGTYTNGTCTLALSGSASKANYATALSSVQYNDISDDPTTATDRTVSFTVNDGTDSSTAITRTVTVTGVNDPPTAADVTVNGLASVPTTYAIGTLSGTDVESGTTVTVDDVAGATNLTNLISVTLNANGSFTITPTAGFVGDASFKYKVKDDGRPAPGVQSTNSGTVTIHLGGTGTYFVKSTAVGAGNCTLGAECTLATALDASHIGSTTGKRIFISDANTQGTTAVTLNDTGWLVGQGVSGTDFASVMGYTAAFNALPTGTTLPTAFPSINQTQPTVGGTVTVHNNSNVLGLKINVSGSNKGLVGSSKSGVVVSDVDVTSASGNAIDLTSTTATFSGGNMAIVSGAGTGLAATGSSTVTVNGPSNTIASTGGKALDVGGSVTANLTFAAVSSTNSATTGVSIGAAAGTIDLGSSGGAGSITGSTGTAFDVTGGAGGTAAITYGGNITKTADGSLVSIANRPASSGNVTLSGTLSCTSNCDGINVSNNASGTIAFSGGTKTLTTSGSAAAVNLSSNAGATIDFTNGGLAISTAGGTGFNASGGATAITVQGSSNTINSTGATALNVNGTTIGAGGLTFLSISAGTAASGPTNGIVLNNTGSTAGLTVTGSGSSDGTGGTIQKTTGDGISLTSTAKVLLKNMNVQNNLGSGIAGSTVNGFVVDNLNITGNGDSLAADESGINIAELTGSASGGANPTSITNSTITENFEFQVQISNSTGTLTNLQMSGNTITHTPASLTGNLFNFLATGSATMTLNLTSGSFTGNAPNTGTGVQCDHSGTSGLLTCNVSNSAGATTFTNNNVAVAIFSANGGNVAFDINGISATGNRSHGIDVFTNASTTGTVNGKIRNNTIGTNGVQESGSKLGHGITIQNEGVSTSNPTNVLIDTNTIREVGLLSVEGGSGINVNQGITGPTTTTSRTTNVTITNNTISDILNGRAVIVSQNNSTNSTSAGLTCADVHANHPSGTFGGAAGDGTVLRFRELSSNGGTLNITQKTPTAAVDPAELDDANSTTVALISISGTPTFNAGSCTQPNN